MYESKDNNTRNTQRSFCFGMSRQEASTALHGRGEREDDSTNKLGEIPERTIDGDTTDLHLHNLDMELKGREMHSIQPRKHVVEHHLLLSFSDPCDVTARQPVSDAVERRGNAQRTLVQGVAGANRRVLQYRYGG
ncbi:hypothetical protein TNCV_1546401 [Trichonephila clavipes]|nr:hypothetical protein TNCV_1546401 [Trichonephila clavipes]